MTLELPVQYAERGFGALGAIPRPTVCFCDGPVAYGEGHALFERYDTRWAVWQASDGIRLVLLAPTFGALDTEGALAGLFDGESYTQLTAAFDGAGYPAIAVQQDATTIELRKFEEGSPVTFSWTGKSPALFYLGLVRFEATQVELVCYYLSADGTQLLSRFQRDDFAVPYVVQTLPVALDRLTKVDRKEDFVYLWGMTTGATRPVVGQTVLRSCRYPAFPQVVGEPAQFGISAGPGEYGAVVVTTPEGLEASDLSLSAGSGAYTLVVVLESGPEDASEQSLAPGDGEYEQVIIPAGSVDDTSEQTLEAGSGAYTELVKPAGANSEKAELGLTPGAGSYSAA